MLNFFLVNSKENYWKTILPFKCQYCGADFKLNSHLKQHMITHTGEKPFNCKECGASFKQGKQLKKHKLKHNGENLVGAMEEKIPVDVKQEEYREESMVICLVDIKQEEQQVFKWLMLNLYSFKAVLKALCLH